MKRDDLYFASIMLILLGIFVATLSEMAKVINENPYVFMNYISLSLMICTYFMFSNGEKYDN